ncbi:MAG TPA: low affinity iron permease family protein [Dehalococcoidia bacterium]|nr:low affinity iron permease family protein [Dehalococcoidia bacterium]
MNERFRRAAHYTSTLVGSPPAFMLAFFVVLVWAVSGPFFGFSDTWQLVINTGTTIVTFLMVFLIQNTQNRDSRALHMKLDDLILHTKGPDNMLVHSDTLSDEEMDELEKHYHDLARVLGKEEAATPKLEREASPARARLRPEAAGSRTKPANRDKAASNGRHT